MANEGKPFVRYDKAVKGLGLHPGAKHEIEVGFHVLAILLHVQRQRGFVAAPRIAGEMLITFEIKLSGQGHIQEWQHFDVDVARACEAAEFFQTSGAAAQS